MFLLLLFCRIAISYCLEGYPFHSHRRHDYSGYRFQFLLSTPDPAHTEKLVQCKISKIIARAKK